MDRLDFPHIQESIENFLYDEEGNIPRNKVVTLGSMMLIMSMMLASDIFAAHRSHSSHSSHRSHSSGSSGYHSSHSSHKSHRSHTSSSHGSHSSSSHGSHSSASAVKYVSGHAGEVPSSAVKSNVDTIQRIINASKNP